MLWVLQRGYWLPPSADLQTSGMHCKTWSMHLVLQCLKFHWMLSWARQYLLAHTPWWSSETCIYLICAEIAASMLFAPRDCSDSCGLCMHGLLSFLWSVLGDCKEWCSGLGGWSLHRWKQILLLLCKRSVPITDAPTTRGPGEMPAAAGSAGLQHFEVREFSYVWCHTLRGHPSVKGYTLTFKDDTLCSHNGAAGFTLEDPTSR